MPTLTVETERKTQLLDVTALVRETVAGTDGAVVTLFVPHTTAGVVLQAGGSSVTIPLLDGELGLGSPQTIFLCEFDGPRKRTLIATVHD